MRGALLVALLGAACSNRPSTSQCENTVDHMIDIFVAPRVPAGGSASSDAIKDAETWKTALKGKDPVRAALIETCRTQMTDSVASCILGAQDEPSLAACFSD